MNILSGQGPKLLSAAERGDLEVVRSLVTKNPNLIKHKSLYGNNALHNAAANGRLEVVVWLLTTKTKEGIVGGADPFEKDGKGKTALERASNNQHTKVVEFLQRHMSGTNDVSTSTKVVPIPSPPPPHEKEKLTSDTSDSVADGSLIPVPPPPSPRDPHHPLQQDQQQETQSTKKQLDLDELTRRLQTTSMEELVVIADRLGLSTTATTSSSTTPVEPSTTIYDYHYGDDELGDFFRTYEKLQRKAATLATDRSAYEEASSQHLTIAKKLEQAKSSIQQNLSTIKEETERIELVSSHWFYGTTALQPQTWLRGGCQGKIERANEKLKQAQNIDLPRMIQIQAKLCELEAVAKEYRKRKEIALKESSRTDQERKQMKEGLINQHPSARLNRLREDEAITQREIDNQKKQMAILHQIDTKLKNAKTGSSRVIQNVRSANETIQEAERLAKEEVFLNLDHHGSSTTRATDSSHCNNENNERVVVKRGYVGGGLFGGRDSYMDYKKYDCNGNLLLTNHPCPNGCGYVITWHGKYCCSRCEYNNHNNNNHCGQNNNNLGGSCNIATTHHHHGPKCDRIRLSSQEGAEDLWKILLKQRQHHQEKIESKRREASDNMQNAVAELQTSYDHLRSAASNITAVQAGGGGGSSSSSSSVMFIMPSVVVAPGGTPCFCSGGSTYCSGNCYGGAALGGQGSMLCLQAHQLQSAVKEQESLLSGKLQCVNRECNRFERQLSDIRLQIVQEENVIFDSLRTRCSSSVRPPATTPTIGSTTIFGVPHPDDIIPMATATLAPSDLPNDAVTASIVLSSSQS